MNCCILVISNKHCKYKERIVICFWASDWNCTWKLLISGEMLYHWVTIPGLRLHSKSHNSLQAGSPRVEMRACNNHGGTVIRSFAASRGHKFLLVEIVIILYQAFPWAKLQVCRTSFALTEVGVRCFFTALNGIKYQFQSVETIRRNVILLFLRKKCIFEWAYPYIKWKHFAWN